MKKVVIFPIIMLFLALLIVSCDSNSVAPEPEEGRLVIHLPARTNTAERSLTNAQAAELTKRYWILAWDKNGTVTNRGYEYGSNLPDNGVVSDYVLTPGTYKVLVIATPYRGAMFLGGVGYTENVVITRGNSTEASIVLNSIDFEVTTPTERIFNNDSFNVSVKLDAKIPQLKLDSYSVIAYNFKENQSDTKTTTKTVKDNVKPNNTNLIYEGTETFSLKASSFPQDISYKFSAKFVLNDSWIKDSALYFTLGFTEAADAYDNLFKWTITVEDETAYLNAAISWAPDPEPQP